MSRVLIIESSFRPKSNSNQLAASFGKGAEKAGHQVTTIKISDLHLHFCTGCLSCAKEGRCVLKDGMASVLKLMKEADAVAFAFPIYYYSLPGQLKTFLDRCNPLFGRLKKAQSIFALATAQDDSPSAFDKSQEVLKGWIDCFEMAHLKGFVKAAGVDKAGDIENHPAYLEKAEAFGASIV